MQREDREALFGEAIGKRKTQSSIDMTEQSVDHGVPNEGDFTVADTFSPKVFVGHFIRCEKQIGDSICTKPIDLFRHGHIAGAQSSLYMRHTDPKFLCGNGAA